MIWAYPSAPPHSDQATLSSQIRAVITSQALTALATDGNCRRGGRGRFAAPQLRAEAERHRAAARPADDQQPNLFDPMA